MLLVWKNTTFLPIKSCLGNKLESEGRESTLGLEEIKTAKLKLGCQSHRETPFKFDLKRFNGCQTLKDVECPSCTPWPGFVCAGNPQKWSDHFIFNIPNSIYVFWINFLPTNLCSLQSGANTYNWVPSFMLAVLSGRTETIRWKSHLMTASVLATGLEHERDCIELNDELWSQSNTNMEMCAPALGPANMEFSSFQLLFNIWTCSCVFCGYFFFLYPTKLIYMMSLKFIIGISHMEESATGRQHIPLLYSSMLWLHIFHAYFLTRWCRKIDHFHPAFLASVFRFCLSILLFFSVSHIFKK